MIDAFSSATQQAAAIRARKVSCRELVEFQIERVSRFNPALNAVISTDFERAIARAVEADDALARGNSWGPFHGVPVTVPEGFGTCPSVNRGTTTYGTVRLANGLFASGANVFGESNGQLSDGRRTPPRSAARNPWNLARTAGRRSGGAASALAAGLTALETGGGMAESVGTPAHYCGLYSHRPTSSLLSDNQSGLNIPATALALVGHMARSAYDLATTVALIGGQSGLEASDQSPRLSQPSKQRLSDYRVSVVLEAAAAPVDPAVRTRIMKAVEVAAVCGAKIDYEGCPPIPGRGAAHSHASESRDEAWRDFFEQYDLLICPAAANVAPLSDTIAQVALHENVQPDHVLWTDPSALSKLPITVAPVGRTSEGLPVGMQIVGPQYGDLTCIGFARMLEDRGLSFEPPPGY